MKKKKTTKPRTAPLWQLTDPATLWPLLAEIETTTGLQANEGEEPRWDYFLIGDGSGCDAACGWSTILFDRHRQEVSLWYGAMNKATVNFAEAMAYLQPLTYLANHHGDHGERLINNVHILTDSRYCAETGNARNRALRKNASLWLLFDHLARSGLILHWHWQERGTTLNKLADRLARGARLLLQNADLTEEL